MANIQEFMTQLASENQRIEEENSLLNKQNESFQQLSSANQQNANQSIQIKHDLARQVTDLEQIFRTYDGEENRFDRKERNYKRDL